MKGDHLFLSIQEASTLDRQSYHSTTLTKINIGPYQITMASVDPAGISPNLNFSFWERKVNIFCF
uniref:Putative ovule protein n=1 Tax=Solanum chacoense TaxID=4108 RepID=A0A0V0HC72_SOLCH